MNRFPEFREGTFISQTKKAVWSVEFEIMRQFIIFCKKNNLTYYLSGGTLLGAVRHKGFIPWDDDIDVMMPRKDYSVFIEKAQDEIPSNIFVQTSLTDKGRNIEYCQLRDINTTAIEQAVVDGKQKEPIYNQGIFIDVFPIDNVGGRLHTFYQKCVLRLYQHVYSSTFFGRQGFYRKVESLFWTPVFNIIGDKRFFKKRTALFSKCRKAKNGKTGITCFLTGNKRNQWNPEWMKNNIEMPFEDFPCSVPASFDDMLTKIYGNWHEFVKGIQLHSGYFFNPYISYKDKECRFNLNLSKDTVSDTFKEFRFDLINGNESEEKYCTKQIQLQMSTINNCSSNNTLQFREWIENRRKKADLTLEEKPETTYWIFFNNKLIGYFQIQWFLLESISTGKIAIFLDINLSKEEITSLSNFCVEFGHKCGVEKADLLINCLEFQASTLQ